MERAFLKKLIDRDFNNLTADELSLIISNKEVFGLKKKKDLKTIEKLISKGIDINKDKIGQTLEEVLPDTFSIFSNLDEQGAYSEKLSIDLRNTLLNTLKQMNQLQLCVFINKTLKFKKDYSINFFRKFEYSLHEINSVVSKALGLSLVFQIFKTGAVKSFTIIDYNKIDTAQMVATLNDQLVRHLYILEVIARVVLNAKESNLFGTKINKAIKEEILPIVPLVQKENKTIEETGIKAPKTWIYTLCNSTKIELADNEANDDEEEDE